MGCLMLSFGGDGILGGGVNVSIGGRFRDNVD